MLNKVEGNLFSKITPKEFAIISDASFTINNYDPTYHNNKS